MITASIPLDDIRRRKDARHLNDEAVASIADSIKDIGQLSPVTVRRVGDGFELIAGSHRYAAVDSLGLAEIDAIIVEVDDIAAELAMIDENLCRAELSPSDRAAQTARRKAIYLDLHPETAKDAFKGNQHVAADNLSVASFADATAAVIGADARTVRRDAERGEKVIPQVLELIRGSVLDTGVYLDKLKRLAPHEQLTAARRDLAYERTKTRDTARTGGIAARYAATTAQATPTVDLLDRFVGLVSDIEKMPVNDLISSAGRQRAVLGQRASGLIDRLNQIMEALS